LERFFILGAIFCILLNFLNSYKKQLLRDGFNISAIGKSLMKIIEGP